jgi:hypothetical protein
MKYDVKKALTIPLSSYEQEIEDEVAGGQAFRRPDLAAEFEKAAQKTLIAIRGGARKGAGRKGRPHIRTTVLLAPPLRRKLEVLATRDGSLSAAVEKLIQSAQAAA